LFGLQALAPRLSLHLKIDNELMAKEAIMEIEGLEIIRMELKYCERCGGLWLRVQGTGEVYCPPCAEEMSDLPEGRTRRLPLLLVNDRVGIESESEIEWEELPPCGEWGNA